MFQQNLRIEVEMLVLSCHLFKRVATLLSIEMLTDFQLQSLGLLKKWLKYMSILDPEYSTTLMAASSLLEEVEELGDVVPSLELCDFCRADILLNSLLLTFFDRWRKIFKNKGNNTDLFVGA